MVGGNGFIYTTFDGGENWVIKEVFGNYFRSVGFLDQNNGFAGSLAGRVFRTKDGGNTWHAITQNFPIQKPVLCGISCVDGWIFATGNYAEPAEFFKSNDEGEIGTFNFKTGKLYNREIFISTLKLL